jgi:hypothetical protein
MKTALKTASTATVNTLKRWIAIYQMRSAERALHDAYRTLDDTTDPETRDVVMISIHRLSRELCRTRAHYQSFLPAGRRIVFERA